MKTKLSYPFPPKKIKIKSTNDCINNNNWVGLLHMLFLMWLTYFLLSRDHYTSFLLCTK